jgi:ProP effector
MSTDNIPDRRVVIAALTQLADRWPQCFFIYGRRRRPLQIGISKLIDSQMPELGDILHHVMRYYTGSPWYQRAMKAGAPRIGLDGSACGVVGERDAELARHRLIKLDARRQQRLRERRKLAA